MSIIADHLSRVKASAANLITAQAMQLEREGRDIIRLSAGEPDFDTPDHIKFAAIRAMVEGKTKYAPVSGLAELREAICAKLWRDNSLHYDPSEILVSSGGKQVAFNAIMATINPGDEVIIPAPYWVSYPDMVRLSRGEPVIVPTDVSAGFVLKPQVLEAAITPKTKWLILNNPGNPSGCVYSHEALAAIAEVLERHPQVWVLSDDIYEYLVYDGTSFETLPAVAPVLKERSLVLNGVSKAYCMTGWRIGYGAGPKALIDGMAKIQSQCTTTADTIAQWASVAALLGDHEFIKRNNQSFTQRRDMSLERLNSTPGLSCARPHGAFYLYVSCEGLIGRRMPDGRAIKTDHDVVKYLLDREGVALVHGEAFGMSPFFRISYASSEQQLEDAYARIRRACEALS